MSHATKKIKHQTSLYLVGSIVCFILFIFLAIIVKWNGSNLYLNVYLHQVIGNKFYTLLLSYIAIIISLFGDKFVIIPTIIITSFFLFFKQQKRLAVHLFSLIVLAAVLAYSLKNTLAVPRPGMFAYDPNKFAFPSFHMVLFSSYLIFLSTLVPKMKCFNWLKIVIIAVLLVLESLSRLLLGVHWLTDVIGGILLGTACGLIGAYSFYLKPTPGLNLHLLFKTLSLVFCFISIFYSSFFWTALMHKYHIHTLR